MIKVVIQRRSSGPYISGSRIDSYGTDGRKSFSKKPKDFPDPKIVSSGCTLEELRRISDLVSSGAKSIEEAMDEVLGPEA